VRRVHVDQNPNDPQVLLTETGTPVGSMMVVDDGTVLTGHADGSVAAWRWPASSSTTGP
jgi:hypothetical protein